MKKNIIYALVLSCAASCSSKTGYYNSFDTTTLNPRSNENGNPNSKYKIYNDHDGVYKFYDKTNKLLKEDSILFYSGTKYLISKSLINIDTISVPIYIVSFIKDKKLCIHHLAKYNDSLSVVVVSDLISADTLQRKFPRTEYAQNSFKKILDYIEYIQQDKFIPTYAVYEKWHFYSIGDSFFYKRFEYHDWGISQPPEYACAGNVYGCIYLDLNKIILDDRYFKNLLYVKSGVVR